MSLKFVMCLSEETLYCFHVLQICEDEQRLGKNACFCVCVQCACYPCALICWGIWVDCLSSTLPHELRKDPLSFSRVMSVVPINTELNASLLHTVTPHSSQLQSCYHFKSRCDPHQKPAITQWFLLFFSPPLLQPVTLSNTFFTNGKGLLREPIRGNYRAVFDAKSD